MQFCVLDKEVLTWIKFLWAETKDLIKLNIFCVVQKCLISKLSKHFATLKKFDVFSVTWEKILIEWVPQPVKQKTRRTTPSERKWCVGLSSSVVSLSPGSQLNTHLSRTIQAARLRVGGSGLQTMSNIWEQSFCTITTSIRVAKMGGITRMEGVRKSVYEWTLSRINVGPFIS